MGLEALTSLLSWGVGTGGAGSAAAPPTFGVLEQCTAAKLLWRRLSAAAYGCALLLLVTFALHELAVS